MTIAVTYRLVASSRMLDIVAGALARSIFTTKNQLLAETPAASQIEAPDPDEKNPILPIHPGVAAYLSSGEQSFFDEFQEYFYLAGILLSMLGSIVAVVAGRISRRKSEAEQRRVAGLIEIADKALSADKTELEALEQEFKSILAWFLQGEARSAVDPMAFSVAVTHARHAIDHQSALLQRGMGVDRRSRWLPQGDDPRP